ncbi:cation/H(+) antiporter 24-like protein [Tanacetum coccineum]
MNTIQPWKKKMNQDMIKLHFEEIEYIESYDKLARENTLSKGFEEIEEGLRDEKYDTQLKHQKGYWQIICSGSLTPGTYPSSDDTIAAWMFPGQSAYIFRNIGSFAFMYFCFVTGVKMDLLTIKRATKKQWYIALFGMLVPVIATGAVALSVRNSLEPEMKKISSIWGVSTALGITSFPVLYPIIRELNLLSSDIGRMALSTAVIGDVVGIYGVITFEAAKQGEGRPLAPIGYILSLIVVLITIFGGNRMLMFQIIKKTPEGKPVEQFYIVTILAGVLAWGFVSDFLGIALVNGPMWFGLAIPDGPPLGATLVQKSESFISDILMPFAYINMGLMTDVFAMSQDWLKLQPLFFIIMTGYLSKFLSTLFMTRFFEMPLRDGVTLSLIMSLRGQVEFLLFIHWLDFQMIGVPQFTMFVLFTTLITSIITPLISIFYNPNRPYMINKRRNIQHTPPNTELQIVVCFVEEESVPSMTHLLEVFNPTVHSPFLVYSLHLRELIGRAAPMFIDHSEEDNESDDKTSDIDDNGTIHKAFQTIQETRRDVIKVHSFTSVAPKRSMYQDVCELALNKKACMIILPFNVSLGSVAGSDMVQNNVKSLNFTVLDHAPCSVAVLVDKGNFKPPINSRMSVANMQYHFAMLFLGGADAREALACADRMAGNPNVSLTVIRFLAHNGEGENEMEKKLDDGLVTAFWVKYEANEQVAYREVVVRNGEETVAAIRAMNSDYDLWIVGRKLGINPILIEGLSSWSESLELGVIGDYVASVDFRSSASVLVVQQQVLRDRETNSGGMQGRISRYFNKLL